jgi:hypothetical protein
MKIIPSLLTLMIAVTFSGFAQNLHNLNAMSEFHLPHFCQYSPDLTLYYSRAFSDHFNGSTIDHVSLASFSSTQRNLWKPFDPATIAVQTLTWTGGIAASIPLGLVFALSGSNGGVFVVGCLGSSFGIYLGGKWMGGNGKIILTLLGSIPGALLFVAHEKRTDKVGNEFLLYAAIPLSFLGPLFGYHLSASPVYEFNREQSSKPQLAPKVENIHQAQLPVWSPQNFRLIALSIEL